MTPAAAKELAALAEAREPFLIGIRHHSPALAVAIPKLLDAFAPDILAIELPAEAAPWLSWLTHPDARSPLAMAFSQGEDLSFYPFADFSPELAALRWAEEHQVAVACIDLPIAARTIKTEEKQREPAGVDPRGRAALAARARCAPADSQETWDRLVEAHAPSSTAEQIRQAALAHGWASRLAEGGLDPLTAAREQWMSSTLAAELAAGHRVAAVVGAFHAPALLHPVPGDTPAETVPVSSCLVGYSFAQLDSRSGYPAGIRDPAWQQMIWQSGLAAEQIKAEAGRIITEVTRQLRAGGHPAGPGEAAETLRVALDLATLRGLQAPSRRELIEALTTVLAQGEVLGIGRAVAQAMEQVLVGDRFGRLAQATPASALRGNIIAELTAAKLPTSGAKELVLTPGRGSLDLTRHVLLQRLRIGGISYGQPLVAEMHRGAQAIGARWQISWTLATDATIELATARGLTAQQLATHALLTKDTKTPSDYAELLTEAAACVSPPGVERAYRLIEQAADRVSFSEAVTLTSALSAVAFGHIPGADSLPAASQEQAQVLARQLSFAAVREIRGIEGSDDPADATALAVFARHSQDQVFSLGHALKRLTAKGSPLMQGAATGLLLDAEIAPGQIAAWLDAPTPELRHALKRRLTGLLATAGARFDSAPATLALVERIGELTDEDFVVLLPALRGGFDQLSPEARADLLTDLARLLGEQNHTELAAEFVFSPEETIEAARYDTAARSRLAGLGLTDLAFSPAQRWRLILGTQTQRLSRQGRRLASALDELYGRSGQDALDERHRSASYGPSQLGVRAWEQEIESLFGHAEVQEIFAEAAARGRGDVLDSLSADQVRPSVELLTTALSLSGALSESRLTNLRPLVARLVAELSRELAVRLRPSLTGLAGARPSRRPSSRLDLPTTLRTNLRHVVSLAGRPQVVPVHPVFHAPLARQVDWQLIVVVDVSGSMSESVVFSALTAAILAESPALSVDFLAFNTEVIDFSGLVSDPLALLLEVAVGGGTDIAQALRLARTRVRNPSRTLLVLISDFEEYGPVSPLLGEVAALHGAGVRLLGCAALNDSGTGAYNAGIAQQVAAAGMRVAAVSPLDLARWVGQVVREV